MWTSRLFWRIFAAYAALLFGSVCVFAVILSERQRELVIEQIEQRLHDSAVILRGHVSSAFSEGPSDHLQRTLKELAQENQTRITLVAADGVVIGDSAENPQVMNNHRNRDELQQARRRGFGISQRISPTLGIPMMYYALSVPDDEGLIGYVRVAMPMQSVNARVASVNHMLWGTALAVGLATVALTYFVVGRIIRPLETLTRAARAIAAGDLRQTVEFNTRDELATLSEAFNRMSDELSARVEELQQKSRQLEANSQRLSAVLGSMIEGVIAVDREEQVLFANRSARALLDLPSADLIGRPMWEAVRNATVQEAVRSALLGREGRLGEFDFPRTKSVISLLASRLAGEPCPGVVLVLHDVTELRRLENVRREFVSNVSHELKTPLTTIHAYTETLLNGAVDEPEHARQFLTRIQEQADRLHVLILDLLHLARIESGRDVFEMTALSVGEIVESCVPEWAAMAEAKGLAMNVENAAGDMRVEADAEALRTLLNNLVENAINYTPTGGQVTVRWTTDDSWGRIEVQDTGVGIAQQHQDRVFERFYRVDRARSRELGGTGLGLSIVKHLAQVFGGSVELDSELGRGSTFIVRLPLLRTRGQRSEVRGQRLQIRVRWILPTSDL